MASMFGRLAGLGQGAVSGSTMGAAAGPYGSLIAGQGSQLQDQYDQANQLYSQQAPFNPTQNLQDIYSQAAGVYGPALAGQVMGGEQVSPGSQLPAQMPQQSSMAGPYGALTGAIAGGQSGAPGRFGNIMKGLQGNRYGSLVSQLGMPRRGGNAWGTAGQGAAMGMMGGRMSPWASAGQGAATGFGGSPWGAVQGGIMGGAGGYFGGGGYGGGVGSSGLY